MGKYKKCPRCELNYILEDEDYCHVCKSEMKHHTEQDEEDELLDFDEMDICPVCGTNYIKESETMCSECKAKAIANGEVDENLDEWDGDGDSLVSTDADSEDDYNSGFGEEDPTQDEIDSYKDEDDDLPIIDEDEPALDFGTEEEIDEPFVDESVEDDFESIGDLDDIADDEDDEIEDDEDDDLGEDLITNK